jgi:hypothetical protein
MPAIPIEDHHRIGRQRDPDCHRPAWVHDRPGRGHGGFGRTVDVEEATAGPVPAGDQVTRARFARHEQEAQLRELIFQRGQQRGHAAQRRDVPLAEERAEVQANQAAAVRLGDERGAAHPRHPDLLDGEVERDRHPLVHPVVAGDPVRFGGYPDEVADAPVADRYALGPAGRAGRVDDVSKLVGRRRHLVRGELAGAFRVDHVLGLVHPHQLDLAGQRPEPGRDGRAGQDEPDPGVGGDIGHPVRREADVQRHEGGVRLEDRQHADVAVHGYVGQQADPVAGLDTLTDQEARQLVRPGVKLGIRQRAARGVHRQVTGLTLAAQPVAALFEQVLKPLAGPPSDRIVVAVAGQHAPVEPAARSRTIILLAANAVPNARSHEPSTWPGPGEIDVPAYVVPQRPVRAQCRVLRVGEARSYLGRGRTRPAS